MTNDQVIYHLRNLGVHHDAFDRDVCEQMYKIGVAFAKMVKESTIIHNRDKWYQEGVTFEREESLRKSLAELEMSDASDAWSEVLNATQWVNELRGGEVVEPVEPLCYLQETDILGGAYEQVVWGEGFPVYIAPPQREWVSLTGDDMEAMFLNDDGIRIARYIEAKLKELNNE